MVARVTLAEVDSVRMSVEEAIERFHDLVVPVLREQEGYEGFFLLSTPEGKGLVLTFWESPEAADQSVATGYYAEQIEKFVTFFRAPPGREQYEVVLAEAPVTAARAGGPS